MDDNTESIFGAFHEYATYHTTPPDAFPEQNIVYARPRIETWYGNYIEGYDSWFAGPAATENLDGTAYLKPEPSICLYGFDPLDYRSEFL